MKLILCHQRKMKADSSMNVLKHSLWSLSAASFVNYEIKLNLK